MDSSNMVTSDTATIRGLVFNEASLGWLVLKFQSAGDFNSCKERTAERTLVPRTAPVNVQDFAQSDCSYGWCERGDSNPHGFTRQILSLVRLPIPPLSHCVTQIYRQRQDRRPISACRL